ncbi:3-hydroxyacyl-CoA dehydrogenase NAD-binding domain-containing protein [Bradyrhizobium sp. AZCC 2289]|uniref:3-hydroxyacyl-CoA dehydrogenase NAD-binding domain-containing protein n=1 Tax=Bradyrhizobium sp. AZCC 2289 TaxID=3117026 RepID=UPI002FF0FB06
MSGVVKTEIRDGLAILTIDNPPVNALSIDVRRGLSQAIENVSEDTQVRAVVITCAGCTFISGADIREFGKPFQPPNLTDVISQIDGCNKPVIAAIHGVALGGGLEVALGCHFRIATKDAKLGLPEVKLGLLPGAGGTQRLPRAVGPELAVRMIVSGEPISAAAALNSGLIDEVVDGSAATGGETFARTILAEEIPIRRLRDDDSKLLAARNNRTIFTDAVAAVNKKNRGLEALVAAADAVGWSLDVPFDEALTRESNVFLKLMSGDQSKAQRYAFFAERDAAKIVDLPAGTEPRRVATVAIIGAGTMGGGIAMSFANAGVPVTLLELAQEPLDHGLNIIRKNYEATAARSGLSADWVSERLNLINGAVGLAEAKDADLVVEAVYETMVVKLDVFKKLDQLAKPGAVLATNTSFLDVNKIGAATKRPQDVIGLHFFSPANVMRLCEIVRGYKTAPDVLATGVAIARRIGKVPAVVGVCHGFVGNRMLMVRGKQADKLLLEGVLPQQVDAVITKFGMPMGPFAMLDLAGLDIGWRSRKDRGETSEIEDALCEAGRFGQKTGKGYYRYEQGSRSPLPDTDVENLITNTWARRGLKRRAVSDDEILDRILYPMINEGARILEEGIAARASDIDVVWLYGYGWPIHRGGPMYYADEIGLAQVAERLSYQSAIDGDASLRPSSLLSRLASSGQTFASFNRSRDH